MARAAGQVRAVVASAGPGAYRLATFPLGGRWLLDVASSAVALQGQTPGRTSSGDGAVLTSGPAGAVPRIRAVTTLQRCVDEATSTEVALALRLRRLGRATAPACGQKLSVLADAVARQGRVTRARQGVRTPTAAAAVPEALVGVEGITPAPEKRVGA